MKDKKVIIVIVVTILLIFGLAYIQTQSTKAVKWTPTFINTGTQPYDTYITYDLLKDAFDKGNIHSTRTPIYNNVKPMLEEYIYYGVDYGESESKSDYEYENTFDPTNPIPFFDKLETLYDTTAYIFINQRFDLDRVDLEYFLDFIAVGNNVFISAENISYTLLDTLKIKTKHSYFENDTTYTLVDYPSKRYKLNNILSATKLDIDSCIYPSRVLAHSSKNDTVFVQVKFGRGNLFLHTLPSAFANINMLDTKAYDFAFRSLSYLPHTNHVLWDEYQTQGMLGEQSIFRVILNNTPLRIALYITVIGFLLYMIFGSKRIQRIIPVIKPPINSSIEFLGTISNLYYRKKDFSTIAQKRQAFLLNYIRKHFYLSTENIDNEFIGFLHAKSGVEKENLIRLFDLYKQIVTDPNISNSLFLEYNRLLEEFYRNVKNK